jgi:large subunit ribosomal protein L9
MQVILLADVDNVGLRGDVVEVARGFARNFLLPRRLAEQASPGRLADLERRESSRTRHEAKTFDEARAVADKLTGAELRFDVKAGPTGALFGSVTATGIVDELWARHKVRVDRRKVDLQEPIKRIGRYAVPIDLFADVRVEVRTLVVPEGGELPPEEPEVAEEPVPAEPDAAPEAEDDRPEPSAEAVQNVPEPAAPEVAEAVDAAPETETPQP